MANPLLTSVEVAYPNNAILDLTQNSYKHFYDGSEIVVAGRLADEDMNSFKADVKGHGVSGMEGVSARWGLCQTPAVDGGGVVALNTSTSPNPAPGLERPDLHGGGGLEGDRGGAEGARVHFRELHRAALGLPHHRAATGKTVTPPALGPGPAPCPLCRPGLQGGAPPHAWPS